VCCEDFHAALVAGKLERFDAFDESRADFTRWKGFTKPGCVASGYSDLLKQRELANTLRFQPAY